MDFNSLFFPVPAPSYSHLSLFNQVIYVPGEEHRETKERDYIPCSLLKFTDSSNFTSQLLQETNVSKLA
jgi:hypothetical protein